MNEAKGCEVMHDNLRFDIEKDRHLGRRNQAQAQAGMGSTKINHIFIGMTYKAFEGDCG